MSHQSTPLTVTALTANPAPVGLLGFGMTTVLLNLHNAGFFPMSAMILGMGIFYGGLAQVLNEVYHRTMLPLGPVRAA
jgi:uncharacterized protein